MFEKRLKQISIKIGEEKKNKFFILTHKKHRREVYFTNTPKSIRFIERKFNSKTKRIIYFFIKRGLLQPFLKNIYLTEKFGDVIYVGGQIKGFNLGTSRVLSFPLRGEGKEKFIEEKEFQKEKNKEKIAPNIFKINRIIPFSEEELLQEPKRFDLEKIFKEILKYYQKKRIHKIKVKDYLKRTVNDEEILPIIKLTLGRLEPFYEKNVLLTQIHGDFSKEQILVNKDSYFFTDWSPREDLIISDLVNFFGNEEALTNKKLLENNSFRELLKIYPSEVNENLWLYLILNEVSHILRNKNNRELSIKRLNEFLSLNFFLRPNK
jgi:hypothetical protein